MDAQLTLPGPRASGLGPRGRTIAAAIIAALALGLIATGGPAGAVARRRYGESVVGSLIGEPTTIDPLGAQSHAELALVSLVFDTLYAVGDDGYPVPHLATAMPQVSADQLTVRVAIQPGVRFHSGRALTADDVVASLGRMAASRRLGWLLAPISAIRADAGEVVFTLRRPTPELASLLASPHASITRGGRAPQLTDADGSGPFRLSRFVASKRRAVFERWDQHFAGPAFVRSIELSWFAGADDEARNYEAGGADLSFRGAIAFAGHKPKYRTREADSKAVVLAYVGFGRRHKFLSDVRFRRAVSLAISRDGLRKIGRGERVNPTTSAAAFELGGPVIPRNELLARRSEAQTELAKVTIATRPTLEVLVDDSRPDDRDIAEKVVAATIKLGFRAKVVSADAREVARRATAGQCDLYIGQLAPPATDPVLQLAGALALGGGDWARKQLARGSIDLVAAMIEFERQLPILPLFHRAVRVHHRDNVLDAGFDPLARLSYANLSVHGRPRRSR